MALTAKQRNALPDSAFVYRSTRKYPVPTKAQARRAGISERQRLGLHRNALSRAAQSHTSGSPSRVRALVARRSKVGGHAAAHRRNPKRHPHASRRRRRR
jgi:hypothetical protein